MLSVRMSVTCNTETMELVRQIFFGLNVQEFRLVIQREGGVCTDGDSKDLQVEEHAAQLALDSSVGDIRSIQAEKYIKKTSHSESNQSNNELGIA